jgi:hypothetical protein
LAAEGVDERGHLTQAGEIEEMPRVGRKRRTSGVVGGVEGDSGMAAVGQADDDVRALAVADADDRQLLTAERVMRMRDGHASRRGLGKRGSALGICPP